MSTHEVVIVSAKRTPIGAFLGVLAPLTAVQLGSAAARGALESAGITGADLEEVILGCVLPAGLGQAPARQAAVGAGVPVSVPATTVNKMCGSALKAVMLGAEQIRAGSASVVLAGGLESMSNAPYLLPKGRSGYRMGHGEVLDHMFYDGLQSPWDGKLMGCFADATAAKYNFSRAQQDAFASHAQEPEWFTTAPVGAIRKVLEQLSWSARDADLYEINEAFAAVPMAAMHDLEIDHARVNVNGGACALGHPIGATGARILTTLLYALRQRGAKRGIASLCIGGGEAVAAAVELI
jgi:acetyl-CoA C-acetyltransferase